MKCHAGRRMIDPCPLQRDTNGECNACLPCIESWRERAAILEYGQGTGPDLERPTCRTREEAEALATKYLLAELALATKGQRSLF